MELPVAELRGMPHSYAGKILKRLNYNKEFRFSKNLYLECSFPGFGNNFTLLCFHHLVS